MLCNPNERAFYIPHKPVKGETAATKKLRIVFNASTRPSAESPSSSDCLEIGPPMQKLYWKILQRNQLTPVALKADFEKAFLQVRVNPKAWGVLRFSYTVD